MQGVLDT